METEFLREWTYWYFFNLYDTYLHYFVDVFSPSIIYEIDNSFLRLFFSVISDHAVWNTLYWSPFWDTESFYERIWISYYIFYYLFAIVLSILLDLIFYFFWKIIWKYINFKCEKKKLFYIFFRYIPLVWVFWVLIWASLSKNFNFKKDLKLITIWNIIFNIIHFLYFLTLYIIFWALW